MAIPIGKTTKKSSIFGGPGKERSMSEIDLGTFTTDPSLLNPDELNAQDSPLLNSEASATHPGQVSRRKALELGLLGLGTLIVTDLLLSSGNNTTPKVATIKDKPKKSEGNPQTNNLADSLNKAEINTVTVAYAALTGQPDGITSLRHSRSSFFNTLRLVAQEQQTSLSTDPVTAYKAIVGSLGETDRGELRHRLLALTTLLPDIDLPNAGMGKDPHVSRQQKALIATKLIVGDAARMKLLGIPDSLIQKRAIEVANSVLGKDSVKTATEALDKLFDRALEDSTNATATSVISRRGINTHAATSLASLLLPKVPAQPEASDPQAVTELLVKEEELNLLRRAYPILINDGDITKLIDGRNNYYNNAWDSFLSNESIGNMLQSAGDFMHTLTAFMAILPDTDIPDVDHPIGDFTLAQKAFVAARMIMSDTVRLKVLGQADRDIRDNAVGIANTVLTGRNRATTPEKALEGLFNLMTA